MQFSFLRATKSAAATAAMAVALTSPGFIPVAHAQAAAQGTKNWKDRAEYDLYISMTQAQDPKKRLEILNTWQDKYPTTDYSKERQTAFVATYGQLAATDPGSRQKLLDAAGALLKTDPTDFTALYYVTLWTPIVGGTSPTPDQTSSAEAAAKGMLDNLDAAFPVSKKPASTSDADWTAIKNQTGAVAHNTLAWSAQSKKDFPTAETEYKASLGMNPTNSAIAYAYGKMLLAEKKYPEALFEIARAATFDGTGSLPAADRPTILAYYKKVYGQFHGSDEGSDAVIALAKTSALPPADFKITDASTLAAMDAKNQEEKYKQNPSLGLWVALKQSITGDGGDKYFADNVKDAAIPGGANGVKMFSATVISIDPADKPTKVIVAVEDPAKADATLVYETAFAADAVKAGDKIEFSGVGESFTKDPYMVTFKDPESPSIKSAAPKKVTPKRKVTRKAS